MPATFKRDLRCILTTEEVDARVTEEHDTLDKIDIKADEIKKISKDIKLEKANLDKRARDLRKTIRERAEVRPVLCKEEPIFLEKRVAVVRSDTGEVLETRPMTEVELQQKFHFDSPAGISQQRDADAKDDAPVSEAVAAAEAHLAGKEPPGHDTPAEALKALPESTASTIPVPGAVPAAETVMSHKIITEAEPEHTREEIMDAGEDGGAKRKSKKPQPAKKADKRADR